MIRRLAAVAFWLSVTSAASAQFGVGTGFYRPGPYFGVYSGPYFGYYPGAYGGFWSNGYSLYGPPVPTYGIVPGYFGGADQRLSNFPDLRYSWYGPFGWRGGVVPLSSPTDMTATRRYLVSRTTAVCEVRLPVADAEVTINNTSLAAGSAVRQFTTALQPGTTTTVELQASWSDARGIASSRRSAILRPGETTVVDFTSASAERRSEPGAP